MQSEKSQLTLLSTGRNNQPHNNNARPYGRGQANHVDLNEAQDHDHKVWHYCYGADCYGQLKVEPAGSFSECTL